MAEDARIVFMGTSAFAAEILSRLAAAGRNVTGVYTRPDKPAGRGMALRQSPVKALAASLGFPVMQPASFKNDCDIAALASLRPDLLIVAAYGLILPQAVLDIPVIAPVNIHASILPRYRGAAPMQRAIMENWRPGAQTGVSIMRMEAGLDAGPVYGMAAVPIDDLDAAALEARLAAAGGDLLLRLLPGIAAGLIKPQPQDDSRATYARKLTMADRQLDWKQPAAAVHAHIRGVTPWPGAHARMRLNTGQEIGLQVLPGRIGARADAAPGSILRFKKGLAIACADCWYELDKVVPDGRKTMSANDFANGLRLGKGIAGGV